MVSYVLIAGLLQLAALPAASAQAWFDLPGSLYGPPEQQWASCADASWPVTELGEPLAPQKPDTQLVEAVAAIDEARVENIVTTLANFGTRHTLSIQNSSTRGIGAARDWIYNQMQDIAADSNGNMDVFYNSYIQRKQLLDTIFTPFRTSIPYSWSCNIDFRGYRS